MSFRRRDCAIPRLWCGNGNIKYDKKIPDGFYNREGTRYECLKSGFGAGKASADEVSRQSLRSIKYIGEYYEDKFKRKKVNTVAGLKRKAENLGKAKFKKFLVSVLKRKDGAKDTKAYNSVLIHLDDMGVKELPKCHKFPRPNR